VDRWLKTDLLKEALCGLATASTSSNSKYGSRDDVVIENSPSVNVDVGNPLIASFMYVTEGRGRPLKGSMTKANYKRYVDRIFIVYKKTLQIISLVPSGINRHMNIWLERVWHSLLLSSTS
jgi:hypothetical protein